MKKHYGIVGPGALGLLWAAKLAPGHHVSLWARHGPATLFYDLVIPGFPTIQTNLEEFPGLVPEVALVATKSYDALPAIERAMTQWRKAPQAIVLFQNGIGSQDAIAAAFPTMPVLAVTTTEGANRRADGSVVHAGSGLTRLGVLNASSGVSGERASAWARAIAGDFTAAGFLAREEPDIRAALWNKLLINAGVNAFTVLLDKPNGALPGHPYFEEHIGSLSTELSRVSQVQGYTEPAEAIEARIREVAHSTADNISSMLQDVRAGRRTEIDYINGAVVTIAKEHGMAAPVNEMLWQAVKSRLNLPR